MARRSFGVGAGIGILVLALVGCAAVAEEPEKKPQAEASTEASPANPEADAATLSAEDLTKIFTEMQFLPGEYEDTKAMFDSVYPQASIGAACEALMGVRVEGAEIVEQGGVLEFGTSNDRTLTAVVASTQETVTAESVFKMLELGLEACIDEPGVTFAGDPVDATVEQVGSSVTGVDQSDGARLTATVNGVTTTVLGEIARVDNTLIWVVGWDPATNEANVPKAMQMFADRVLGN